MEATEVPSYLCLFEGADLSSYSEDKLNKINSEFIKDYQKVAGIVQYSSIWFGNFIQKIRSKKWEEVEEYRKGAQEECEKLLKHLVTNGLQSKHQQKQTSMQCTQSELPRHPKYKPRAAMKTGPDKPKAAKEQTPGRMVRSKKTSRRDNTGDGLVHNIAGISNRNKKSKINAQEQKKRQSPEKISKSQQTKEIVKKNKTNLVPNSVGNASKPLPKQTILQVNPSDSLAQNKQKNNQINANKPTTGESKEYVSKAEQIHGIAMTNNMPGKTEMAQNSAVNVHKITSTKSVQTSKTHQAITEGQVYRKDSGMLDATGTTAADADIMRRSEEASLLLIQGNPNIADLSDSNRPTKLAQRYSELYSNEYTDAFEELKMKQISERDIIQILLDIVMHAYIYCQRKAKDESTGIQVEVQIDFKKQGYRSENAETLWKAHVAKRLKQRGLALKGNICQNFTGEELPKFLRPPLLPLGNKLSAYVRASVEIVWMMCIQDPPLCVKWIEDENTEKEFDTDLFRFYTKSGKFVEYCVWPVLLLYDGGPLLTKGIAQGK